MMFLILSLFVMFVLLFTFKTQERFSVSLCKQHNLYKNLRDYIDSNYKNPERVNPRCFPGKISSNCFVDKYNKCITKNGEVSKNKCELNSLNKCQMPPLIA